MDDELELQRELPLRPAIATRARRRAVGIGALVAFATFAGGFLAGYAVDDAGSGGGGGGGDEVAAIGAQGDDGSPTADDVGPPPETTIVAAGSSVGSAPDGPYAEPVRSRLFRRDTAAGLSVRVHRTDVAGGFPCGSGWCPPPQCNPSSSIEATVVGEWGIAQGGGPRFELQVGAPARVLGFVTAWAPEDATFGVIVRTADDVGTVRLTLGGVTDEMAPIDGLAVVAVPHPAFDVRSAPTPPDAQLEVVRDGASTAVSLADAYAPSPECMPPPPEPEPLPAPGAQPDDAAAAEAAVRDRFFAVFGQADGTSLEDGVDDPTGLPELRDELRERFPEMIGAVTYEMGDLVFTSPTEATFHFRPIVPNSSTFMFQLGGARVVDGEWKLTRVTVCGMFSLGGAAC